MGFDPVPEVKKGFFFSLLGFAWLIYLFFEPISALIAAAFLVFAIFISHKRFK